MVKWDLQRITVNPDGTHALTPFYDHSGIFDAALGAAASSIHPSPIFSGYSVRAAISWGNQLVVSERQHGIFQGGNIEYGWCKGLHAEESLIAQLRYNLASGKVSRDEPIVIAFACNNPLDPPTPCGNCRDIIRDNLPIDNTFVVGCNIEGNTGVVIGMQDLLKDNYDQSWDLSGRMKIIDYRKLREEIGFDFGDFALEFMNLIESGQGLENDVYSPGRICPRRKYYAVISTGVAGPRSRFYGAHDVNCHYHPRYAIYDAARVARRLNRPYFQHVLIACQDDGTGLPPDVMYMDRQDLLELNFQQECMTGKEHNPSIYLVVYKKVNEKGNKILKLWKTSVKQWLPFPFSPANFGPDFVEQATREYNAKKTAPPFK